MASTVLGCSCRSFSFSRCGLPNSKKRKKREQQQRRYDRQNTTTGQSFPKSSPTPLLINQTPNPQTKHEAFDAVLRELEASIDRGNTVDAEIFSSLLETCFQMQAIDYGIRIHHLIPPKLLRKNVGISAKLLRLYASSGHMDEAHQLFDQRPRRDTSAFAWNSLISGYAELGVHEEAIALYFQMEEEGVEPDQFTFPRVLKACAGLGLIQMGEEIHRHIVRSGFAADGFVLNGLVDMYAKCGDIVKARKIFNKIAHRDLVSWNSMLTSYIHHGLPSEALDIFREMLCAGSEPDSVAISSIVSGFLSPKFGAEIHGRVLRRGLDQNLSITNSFISMYSELGKLDQARWLFECMPERDVVSWNSIIYAHRHDPQALLYFQRMENLGVLPDSITFVSLLTACAHLGLVRDGQQFFLKMEAYKIAPLMEHYACMVNLFGRAGLIDEAYGIIQKMEFEVGPTVWGALLFACSLHGNMAVGEIAAEKLFELEADNAHNFELLMKIYRNCGRLEEVERVRKLMMDRGLDL
ncbi:hypothetical protein NE237_003897 [Protea cynaroides]|uniref:Pentatricopeptide repeat-containing protein n=1 Tax=Protea cynaroides TaxID=273540 RepID=A0A9Q0QT09_9MAGN|nr:hypothetical protein NE237_003897 [Protea cynaroides]